MMAFHLLQDIFNKKKIVLHFFDRRCMWNKNIFEKDEFNRGKTICDRQPVLKVAIFKEKSVGVNQFITAELQDCTK